MPKFITIGYGDREGYDRTDADVRDAAHAHVLTAAGFRANLAAMCGLWSNKRRSDSVGSVVRTTDRRPRQDLRDAPARVA